jgi:phage terminase large subunit GpA-like protein
MSRSDEYFRQLTAEKVVTKYHKGFARREFVKTRPRNEALDVRVYAMAAFAILNININAFASRISHTQHENPPEPEQPQTATPAAQRRRQMPKTGGFVGGWR